ncbi:HAD family hydrolase [Anaerolentibacter hominis]|uniref:HAD family hydrolase n=1 Tax=Anaerolentibacter hominis TaxID=3079009 RepID=UPI0031B84075
MKKYKGIIFDLDGTLLNTIADLSDSVNAVLDEYDYPGFTYDQYKLKIGKGFRNLLENSFPEGLWDDKLIDEALEKFLSIYDKNYMNKTAPYEGIDRMLDELAARNIQVGVNSNKRTDYTNDLIHKFFCRIPFVEIFGEREGIPKKPDPAAALEIAGLMGLKPEEVLYIGDSKTDMVTGKNAGMDTVGVLWGFRDFKELSENGATYIAGTVQDILDIVK